MNELDRIDKWTYAKTDWNADYDFRGNYIGDHFDYRDWDRIRGNILFICDTLVSLHLYDSSPDWLRIGTGYFVDIYASEVNDLIARLIDVCNGPLMMYVVFNKKFVDNGSFLTYSELNFIEETIEHAYHRTISLRDGRRQLPLHFGTKGGL